MTISDMTLPDEVVKKVQNVIQHGTGVYCSVETVQAAIRATLQAMCDCGMAKLALGWDIDNLPVIVIRLSERSRHERQ